MVTPTCGPRSPTRSLHEDALHVEDVLVRRVRLFIESADSGTGAAAEVSSIMGRLLGWSRRKRAAETRRYLELVAAEQAVRRHPAPAGACGWPTRRWPTRRWPTRRWLARRWLGRRWPAGADWHRSGMSMDGCEKPAADVPA